MCKLNKIRSKTLTLTSSSCHMPSQKTLISLAPTRACFPNHQPSSLLSAFSPEKSLRTRPPIAPYQTSGEHGVSTLASEATLKKSPLESSTPTSALSTASLALTSVTTAIWAKSLELTSSSSVFIMLSKTWPPVSREQ